MTGVWGLPLPALTALKNNAAVKPIAVGEVLH